MKTRLLIGFLVSAILSPTAFALTDRTEVPDGAFGYAPFVAAAGLVLMARSDFTTMSDAKTHAVSGR